MKRATNGNNVGGGTFLEGIYRGGTFRGGSIPRNEIITILPRGKRATHRSNVASEQRENIFFFSTNNHKCNFLLRLFFFFRFFSSFFLEKILFRDLFLDIFEDVGEEGAEGETS